MTGAQSWDIVVLGTGAAGLAAAIAAHRGAPVIAVFEPVVAVFEKADQVLVAAVDLGGRLEQWVGKFGGGQDLGSARR